MRVQGWSVCALALVVMACSTKNETAAPAAGGGGDDADASGGGGGAAIDDDIASIVEHISADRISQNIQTLVAFGTRSSCSDAGNATQGIGAARDWIKSQMSVNAGEKTALYAYAQTGCGTPAMQRHDVVAWLPGAAHPERVIVVGGHYDSRTVDVADGTSPAPGANDSGSQTAVVLELAHAFAGHSFDASVVFVAFAGEEQGLVGSKALAADIASVVSNAQVVAMLNCDIVGGDDTANDANALRQFRLYSPGTPRETAAATPDGTTDDTSPSRGLMRYVGTWGAAYVPEMTMIPKLREDRPGRGGDHEPFVATGRPAVRFIEPTENLAHEHTGQDLFTYVTPAYTARVAQVVAAVAASLARAPDAPGGIAASGNAAAPTLTWTAPATGNVDHYVVAARSVTDNAYAARVRVGGGATSARPSPTDMGVGGASAYFVSVAAVDAKGHESLFAYPEYRCDSSGCIVQSGSLDVTATK